MLDFLKKKETTNNGKVIQAGRTYSILDFGDEKAIRCDICKMVSYNKNDIEQKYCGKCHQFHSFLELECENLNLTQNKQACK